jgi:hypothetical protein
LDRKRKYAKYANYEGIWQTLTGQRFPVGGFCILSAGTQKETMQGSMQTLHGGVAS